MTHYLTQNSSVSSLQVRLQECLDLTHQVADHAEANQAFGQIQAHLSENDPQSAALLKLLWDEVIASRRSTIFWQQICDVEKQVSEQLAANHFQLQQNYLRLMQEQ